VSYQSQRTDGTTVTYLSCAETAKLLRAALKQHFPGIKFSVRSDTYSGGASIRVAWQDGPLTRAVNDVADAFSGATFDGMIDLKSYKDPVLIGAEHVHMGADYVFCNREVTEAHMAACIPAFEKLHGPYDPDKEYADLFHGNHVISRGPWPTEGRQALRQFAMLEVGAA
jgi:hypothetical protein